MSAAIHVVAALITDDRGRILLVRKRGTSVFMQPGGKPEPGESAAETLCRELYEELTVVVTPDELHHLGRYSADAANEPDTTVVATVFAAWPTGPVKPSSEIEEIRWLHPEDFDQLPLAPLITEHMRQHLGDGAAPEAMSARKTGCR